MKITLREKCPYLELFWSVSPAFELNTERYDVSLRIQIEFGKLRTRLTPNTDTFYAVSILIYTCLRLFFKLEVCTL